jgi:hypothetical protein
MQQNGYTPQQVQFFDSFVQSDQPRPDLPASTGFNYWQWQGELNWALRNEGGFSSAQMHALEAFIFSYPPYSS